SPCARGAPSHPLATTSRVQVRQRLVRLPRRDFHALDVGVVDEPDFIGDLVHHLAPTTPRLGADHPPTAPRPLAFRPRPPPFRPRPLPVLVKCFERLPVHAAPYVQAPVLAAP